MEPRPYTVHIYESEAKLISKWTLRYPNIETGGDLFGLWINANEIVIQAVLGPGQNCRRTATSFFQDEQYLSEVGESLTQEQGLCNIGSWHSHHTMNLPDPSRGDKDTVWKHLPTPGRFVLLIAAIKTETEAPKVEMGFNLFESTVKGNKITSMKLDILQGESPIRANKGINSKILEGAESHSRSDMKSNAKHDDGKGFFKGQHRERGRRRPLNSSGTCDGTPVSYNTFQRSYYKEFQYPRPYHHPRHNPHRYTYRVHNQPDGRQRITLHHNGHPLGHCRDCCNARATLTRDGELVVERGQGCDDCCSCTIL